MAASRISRRSALRQMAAVPAAFAAPAVFRNHASAAPSETVYHASFGASGMALSDIRSLTASKNLKLVAVADVDLSRDGRGQEALPRRQGLPGLARAARQGEERSNSVNVSTPDHMHAPITMRAMQQGLHVYTQKPLTQTIYEARQLTQVAAREEARHADGHPDPLARSPSHGRRHDPGRGDRQGEGGPQLERQGLGRPASPGPTAQDPVPASLNWDVWLGVAADRPFIAGYYHPGNWRKRLDFGTGTFGDMGCHILDPVFGSLALTAPKSVRSDGDAGQRRQLGPRRPRSTTSSPAPSTPTDDADAHTGTTAADAPAGPRSRRSSADRALNDQGSIYIGTEGVLYSPYIDTPILLPAEKFTGLQAARAGRGRPLPPVRRGVSAATARPRRRSTTRAR